LADATATIRGYGEEDSELYSQIMQNVSKDEFDQELNVQKAKLTDEGLEYSDTETAYKAKYDKFYEEYAEIMGYEINWDNKAKLFGDNVDMPTYGEMHSAIAQSRTVTKLGEISDYYFEKTKSGNIADQTVWTKLLNTGQGEDDDYTYKDYTVEEVKKV
jgi:hypothetical protein